MTVPALSTISLTLALSKSDPAFLEAVDSLGEAVGAPTGLAPLRTQALDAARMTSAWLFGLAAGRQATTRESATGVRCHAHRAGLPVLGGGR